MAFFFYQAKVESEKTAMIANQAVERSSSKPSVDPQELANKYLQQAQQNLVTDKLKAEINIKKAIAETQNPLPPKVAETDPSKVPVEQQIWKEKEPENPTESDFTNLAPKNPGEIDKQEYIRQFKENARRNGYEITVNDDLEVTSVTPIRKPQNSKNDYDSNSHSESEY